MNDELHVGHVVIQQEITQMSAEFADKEIDALIMKHQVIGSAKFFKGCFQLRD
ncbi:MAG: hypothetical protein JWQ71_2755 [Pedosphaera sp.]|nr:hypothetical protein [Pedosphaera sp.]